MNIDNNGYNRTVKHIQEFEKKYRMDSETFYHYYISGKGDEIGVSAVDRTAWAGEIQIALHLISQDSKEKKLAATK